jgi:hypothetical protein
VFKDREPKKGSFNKRRAIEEVNGGNNSTNLKNANPYIRAIHIHGRMEHNLARYAK